MYIHTYLYLHGIGFIFICNLWYIAFSVLNLLNSVQSCFELICLWVSYIQSWNCLWISWVELRFGVVNLMIWIEGCPVNLVSWIVGCLVNLSSWIWLRSQLLWKNQELNLGNLITSSLNCESWFLCVSNRKESNWVESWSVACKSMWIVEMVNPSTSVYVYHTVCTMS